MQACSSHYIDTKEYWNDSLELYTENKNFHPVKVWIDLL